MQAFTAQGVLAARRMCAGAIFRVDGHSWTLINLSHAKPPGVTAWGISKEIPFMRQQVQRQANPEKVRSLNTIEVS
jgi:hypothetical protein